MWKRWLLYSAVLLGAIPVVVWLAFGPLVGMPYQLFTWPADRLVWHLNPSAGSTPSTDVIRDTVLSAGIWLAVLVILDLIVVRSRRKGVV